MGKYTKGVWGARHYTGWNHDGIVRFNQLCQEVKEGREKNAITENLYKTYCITNRANPKKPNQMKSQETKSYVDDISDPM